MKVNLMISIRPFKNTDWPALWSMIHPVFAAGDTYPYPADISENDARHIWTEQPDVTYVSLDKNKGQPTGSYFLKQNHPGRGSHICNCGYIVAENSRGQGIATALCKHSQQMAVERGFRAMQFNLVVSTNHQAVALWKKLGFAILTSIPEAFDHKSSGYVDAYIMHKKLVSE